MKTCEAPIGQRPGPYGFLPQTCRQSVAVRHFWDASGREHTACAIHYEARTRLYPLADPPEPDWNLPDDIDAAKWAADRDESWTLV